MLELGEHLLDGIEIGTVGWQEEQPCARRLDGGPDGLCLVASEIVDDDDIARLEGGKKELFNIAQEALAIDRPVEDARGGNGVMAKRCQEGQCLPVAVGAQEL